MRKGYIVVIICVVVRHISCGSFRASSVLASLRTSIGLGKCAVNGWGSNSQRYDREVNILPLVHDNRANTGPFSMAAATA